MTDDQLNEIEASTKAYPYPLQSDPDCGGGHYMFSEREVLSTNRALHDDIPALIVEVRCLKAIALERAEERARLRRACIAADHLISSLLAVREGATDELLTDVQRAIRGALTEPKGGPR